MPTFCALVIVSNLLWLAMVDHIMYKEQSIFPHSLHHPNYAGAWRVAGYIIAMLDHIMYKERSILPSPPLPPPPPQST